MWYSGLMNTTDDFNDFLTRYALPLNAQQRAACTRLTGQTLLLAVPGSGKTSVVIARTGYLSLARGVDTSRILTLTFSKAGARDLGARWKQTFGDAAPPAFSTIHAFALSLIRLCGRLSGHTRFEVLGARTGVLAGLYRSVMKTAPSDTDLAELENALSRAKNSLLTRAQTEALLGEKMAVRDAYEAYKNERGLIDFDDMLLYAHRLLTKNPQLLRRVQARYTHVQVDEAQDNSKIQHRLIRLLADGAQSLFMVGDEDQSIYSFRGAWPRGLLDFKKDFPDGKILKMETNYRSPAPLVTAADRFIRQNADRYPKKMRAARQDGEEAAHHFFKTIDARDRYILTAFKKEGKDSAVLFRNNDSAITLVDLFEREGAPCALRESAPGLFSSFLIKDLEAFYALASGPENLRAFSNIYYKTDLRLSRENYRLFLKRASGRDVFANLLTTGFPDWLDARIKKLQQTFEAIKRASPQAFIDTVLYEAGYAAYLEYRYPDTGALDCLFQKLGILKTLAAREQTTDGFFDRLGYLKDLMGRPPEKKTAALSLSTIHAAKGLEYDKVYLIDCSQNTLPAAGAEPDSAEGLEEARLFYVAVTRARRELVFLSVGTPKHQPPGQNVSEFITRYTHPPRRKR